MPQGTVRVEGLGGLARAFQAAGKYEAKQLSARLIKAAEPVAADAEGLARSSIRKATLPWTEMRVGATLSGSYIVPKAKGTKAKGKGRNAYKTLLLDRAMNPALDANHETVRNEVDDLLGEVGNVWGRTP